MSAFYVFSNPLVPGTIARAEDLNDSFTAIETATDAIESAIDTKAGLDANNVFSGDNDFSAGTVVVAAPSEGSHPATKLYADTLAFLAGDLPDQTGNAGKFIYTDGTDVLWGSIDGGEI